MDTIERVKKTIRRYELLKRGTRILIGVSGGPDSIALLHILFQLRYDLGIDLCVAHLNHGLRKNAFKDQSFVEKICKKLNVPFISRSLPKNVWTRSGSIEETAREYRFSFLIDTAKKQKADVIALGHTQNDLAETMIMRLLRGTGLTGMRSILPKRKIHGFYFIRPLLDISRGEIEAFLKERKIPFRTDPTNRSFKFLRNRVRKKLLPQLEKEYNPRLKETLAHFSKTVTDDYDYLEEACLNIFPKIVANINSRCVALKRERFQKLHPALKRMVIRQAIARLQGDTNALTFLHLVEIEDLIENRPRGATVHLPKKLFVELQDTSVIFGLK